MFDVQIYETSIFMLINQYKNS